MKLFLKCLLLFFSLAIFSQNQPKKKNLFQTAGSVIKTSFNTIPSDFVFLGKEVSDNWKKTIGSKKTIEKLQTPYSNDKNPLGDKVDKIITNIIN